MKNFAIKTKMWFTTIVVMVMLAFCMTAKAQTADMFNNSIPESGVVTELPSVVQVILQKSYQEATMMDQTVEITKNGKAFKTVPVTKDEESKAITVTVGKGITEPGEYKIVFPEEMFSLETLLSYATWEWGILYNEAFDVTFTIEGQQQGGSEEDPIDLYAEIGDLYYHLNGTEAEVTGRASSSNSDLVIPNTVEYHGSTYSVTSIGEYAFAYFIGLTSIDIPYSVTKIGNYAFNSCTGLTSIDIPYSVTSIGESAFHSCIRLTSVTIPNSVTSIGENAFDDCRSLKSVNISCKDEADFAHYVQRSDIPSVFHASSLSRKTHGIFIAGEEQTEIVIPNSVTSIGNNAFGYCSGLTSVIIGNSVTSIGNHAFCGCSGLTSITIPNSVTGIGKEAFWSCSGLTSVIIGNSVIWFGEDAFQNCFNLKKVVNLSSISLTKGSTDNGYVAYYANVVYKGKSAEDIGEWRFLTDADENAKLWDYTGTDNTIELPENYKGKSYDIADYVFMNRYNMTSVTIPSSVTSIEEGAFYGCRNLEKVYCHPRRSPQMGTDVFGNINLAFSTLYVPDESVNAYSKTAPWSNFGLVLPMSASGEVTPELTGDLNKDGRVDIDDVIFLLALETYSGTAEELAILIENSNPTPISPIEIEALYGDAEYYTLDGVKVSEPTTPGIYIVKKDGESKMIVVKK